MKTMECDQKQKTDPVHLHPITQVQTQSDSQTKAATSLNAACCQPATQPKANKGSLLLMVFILVCGGFLFSQPNSIAIRTLSLIFVSIVLEALPFMLLGAFIGGLIEAFVSRDRLMALLPKQGWMTIFLCAGLGWILPICECAIVPVVRRLGRKGLPPGAAVAYLLGAPIANPIVLLSTAMAYQFNWSIALLRCGLGYAMAVSIGLFISWVFKGQSIFHQDMHQDEHQHHHQQQQHGEGCSCGHHHSEPSHSFSQKMTEALRHAGQDFVTVGHYLVIGAFVAALAQTYIDRNTLLGFTAYPVIAILLMIALAIGLNLCSEADAFIAASFRGLMPLPAQMAFMLTGPMFDLKLLLMYQGVFRKRTILVLSGVILISAFIASCLVSLVWGGLS